MMCCLIELALVLSIRHASPSRYFIGQWHARVKRIGRHLAMGYHCANESTSGSNPTFNIAVHVEIPVTEVGEGIKVARFQDPEGSRIALQERWSPAS